MKRHKQLNRIFGNIAFGIFIVATWLTFSRHPLANKVNHWQMEMMHDRTQYFPVLTIFLLALPPLLLTLLLKLVFIKISRRPYP